MLRKSKNPYDGG
jgi:hypothetical protein